MIASITYPTNRSQWYAKGFFDDGTYFEMPSAFAPDGTCDIPTTDEKVAQLEMVLKARKIRENGQ
jgi:esterase/lipase superfamily enzyme